MFRDKLVATAVASLIVAMIAAFGTPGAVPSLARIAAPTAVAHSLTAPASVPSVAATASVTPTLTPTPPQVGVSVPIIVAPPCACLKHVPPPELVAAVARAFPPALQWSALEVADCESGGAAVPYDPATRGTMDESDGEVPIGTWQMKPRYFGVLPTDYEGQARIVAREVAISGWRYWGCKPSGGTR